MKPIARINSLAAVFWLSEYAVIVVRSSLLRPSPASSVLSGQQLRGKGTLEMPSHSLINSATMEINAAIHEYDQEALRSSSAKDAHDDKRQEELKKKSSVKDEHAGKRQEELEKSKEKEKDKRKNKIEKTRDKKTKEERLRVRKDAGSGDNDTLATESLDQATVQPRNKEFETVDGNHDGKINKQEYVYNSRAGQRIAEYRFECSDANMDKSLNVSEFVEALSKPKSLDKCVTMLLAFKMMDQNQDGHLTQRELWRSAQKDRFDARWAFMIACSDLNDDGKVSPMEFTSDMYGCVEDSAEKAADKFANFTFSDKNADGCIDQDEMIKGIRMLVGLDQIPTKLVSDTSPSQATVKLANRWIYCVDFDLSGCLDKEEFEDGLLNPTPSEQQCIGNSYNQYEDDMDFHIMDTSNDNKVSEQEYYDWCIKLDMDIDYEKARALFESTDANGDHFVTAKEFEDAGKNHQGDGANYLFFHRSRQPAWSMRSLTRWRGSIRKTWGGYFKPSL